MPSPFPGMDPYLEAPDIWPDLHDALAGGIRGELNQALPAPYYARLDMREELGIVEGAGSRRRIVPDVAVARPSLPLPTPEGGGVTVAARTRRQVSPHVELEVSTESIRHPFIEIRDPTRGHKLITLIEIVSPSNKRPGPDRDAYEDKQREVLRSDASLIELDLLRGGRRILTAPGLTGLIERLEPRPLYMALVNRAWRRRNPALAYHVYPFGLRDPLPCIWIPLKEGEDEIALDLQDIFERAYDTGPYRRGAVDYGGPVPAPALEEKDAAWASELTGPWREARAAGAEGEPRPGS